MAAQEDGFLNRLKDSYNGQVPSWSLQEYVRSVLVCGGKKCQIRVYAVACNEHMYIYKTPEVRIPFWSVDNSDNKDTNDSTSVDGFEAQCCEASNAIPYNRNRVKAETNRLLLSEVEEIQHAHSAILATVRSALLSLKPSILSHSRRSSPTETEGERGGDGAHGLPHDSTDECHIDSRSMAIAGIDLMLKETYYVNDESRDIGTETSLHSGATDKSVVLTPLIIELNNNPAMPSPNKRMSALYREHISRFVESVIRLGIAPADAKCDVLFEQLW